MYTFNTAEELRKYIIDEVINTTEALQILGCSRQNLNNLIKRDRIKPIKEMPRDRLFLKSDILAYKGAK